MIPGSDLCDLLQQQRPPLHPLLHLLNLLLVLLLALQLLFPAEDTELWISPLGCERRRGSVAASGT